MGFTRRDAPTQWNVILPFFLNWKYNCFTVLCKFLLYEEVNQLYVCIHPPRLGLPSYPPQSHPSRSSQNTDLETRIYTREKTVSSISGSGKLDSVQFSSVHSLSRVWLFATPWITAHQASLSITNSRSSRKLMSIESVMPSSHLILCHPLLLLPSIPPSIRVFSNESTLRMRWPKYCSFSFSISPSKEIPGLISFRMDWLDLLAVQGTGSYMWKSEVRTPPNTIHKNKLKMD